MLGLQMVPWLLYQLTIGSKLKNIAAWTAYTQFEEVLTMLIHTINTNQLW